MAEVNQYILTHYQSPGLLNESGSSAFYPANQYYHSWNTKSIHAYPVNLSRPDTSYLLVLRQPHSIFCVPVNGKITSNFGYRNSRHHNGIDIDLKTGTPVMAAFEGMVRIAERHGCYGNIVVVRHPNGLETFYAHLSKIKVRTGQTIRAGQVLGIGGSTGRSTGSHLHFETRFKGIPINPYSLISFTQNKLPTDSVYLKRTGHNYFVYTKSNGFHIVKKGESLSFIIKKYHLETHRICELNGISKNTMLRAGRILKIS